jgi:hypothetical protein
MLKKEIRSHLLVTFIWLALVTFFRWRWHWDLVFLWSGGLIGAFLLDLDQLLYVFWIYPQELTSLRVRSLFGQRRFKAALGLLSDTDEERFKLAFHNALFQPIFYVFCFFVLTSTGSLFGAGLVMAMALHLLKEEIKALLWGREELLRKRLFWLIRGEVSLYSQKLFVVLMLLIFLGLNLLLI